MYDYTEIEAYLEREAEPDFRLFTMRLMPGVEHVLGVRLPKLRKLGKKLAKGDYRGFLADTPDSSYEMIMLKGIVIGYVKGISAREHLKLAAGFIPKIDNWSVCDIFCGGLKFTKEAKEEVWEFLKPCFASEAVFAVRFAFVMALNYYIEEAYLEELFSRADEAKQEDYYVKMAVAWMLSMCYVNYPERTEEYLSACALDAFTYRKTIQKICESRQVEADVKKRLREMKRI